MFLRWTVIGAAMALWLGSCPPAALAQPVFFDDFDGPDLLPHWQRPNPSHWDYDVSGGRLNVTDLHFPGIAHLEANFASIGAFYEPQGDFRMDVWMGWDRAPAPQYDELVISVRGPVGGIMAEFGLRSVGAPPAIVASAGGGRVFAPPPPPGIHQFTITRTGSKFDFYLGGEHFGSLADTFGIAAGSISIDFSKPFPGDMNPKHVDRVRVIPAPGAIMVSTLCAITCARRRR